MAEIANTAAMHRTGVRRPTSHHTVVAPLSAVASADWQALADRAAEPNGYFLPGWMTAVDASARDRSDVAVLRAWQEWAPTLPEETTTSVAILRAADVEWLYPNTSWL